MKENILIIDDEKSIRFTLSRFLEKEGYEVTTAENYEEGLKKISEKNFDVIFSDIIIGNNNTGIDILSIIKEKNLNCPVIMFTGYPNLDTASKAVRLGAFDYISKPIDKETIINTALKAIKHKSVIDENEKYRLNLEAIFRSVEDGIITIDKNLNIIEVNEATKNISNIFKNSTGNPFECLCKECNLRICLEAVKETITKKTPVKLYRHECQDREKTPRVITLSINPLIGSQKECLGAVMVIRDETHLVEMEHNFKDRQVFYNIIGKNDKMQKIYKLLERLTDMPTTVLVTGETGTGKELIAEALHYKGIRSDKPLVKVNCSALPESLLESELFGHVKGAFTSAIKDKKGRFEYADGGTIFLDEIGDISPAVQLRLLRVLQEREFERVGDTKTIKVDVRIIGATNQNLREKVKDGTFREDLYYRLKVIEVKMPPLRERKDDIPFLVDFFIKKFNKKLNKNISGISRDVQKLFLDYTWPGNIRELEHAIEHSFVLSGQDLITSEDLPSEIIYGSDNNITQSKRLTPQLIIEALENTGWNKLSAARLLGVNRKTIYRYIEKYKIIEKQIE